MHPEVQSLKHLDTLYPGKDKAFENPKLEDSNKPKIGNEKTSVIKPCFTISPDKNPKPPKPQAPCKPLYKF